ncbi:FHA domain-containing protein [Actinomycetospora chiangmaiensis]|uniref:FHA domain-containing protein n=1 Tax=Actinomycetospora chiangmaiensis TaxID=402650 RepID=UPI00037021A0|nr:FHA domain-containing protein [Actinomycetospora chiangmaiensis]
MTQLDDAGPTTTVLEIRAAGHQRIVRPGAEFVIGRDETCDLQVLGPQVSRRHLVVRPAGTTWEVTDVSRNGSFVGGRPLGRQTLHSPTAVHLGSESDAPLVEFLVRPRPAARPTPPVVGNVSMAAQRSGKQGKFSAVHDLRTTPHRLRIGRDERNDVVIADLLASRNHAELQRHGDQWVLVDLGSANGTFVNGQRIRQPQRIGPADVVGIGHALLHLEGDRLVERVDAGEIGFRAEGIVVRTAKGKQLLDDVGFALESKSLLAVVGPSGAGKSTLLKALTGFRPADEGRVEYAGRDLYAEYDELRARIGLVPQDDILHPQLTVRRALRYAAELRFPDDVGPVERAARIDEVIAELGLSGQADQPIHTLSGGQRKRTSVALELLTRPSLLFLDEPTSGLDPGLDKSVMRTLRGLADDGRTVVVVTHSVANLDLCDRLLLLAPGGQVAYFGPPDEALAYFGRTDFADVFLLLQERDDWGERFRRSPAYSRYVGRADEVPGKTVHLGSTVGAAAARQQSVWRQLSVLGRRYLAVIAADRQYLIFMAALPLVLSLLAHALPGDAGLSIVEQQHGAAGAPNSLWLVLVVGAALMGSAASIRELVKEREIYRRERAIGLSRGAYLASKLVILGVIVGLQAVVLGVLGTIGRPPPDAAVLLGSPVVEIVVALVVLTLASMAVGLAVSALIDNADRGMPLLVLLAMLQFILSSALLQIGGRPGLGQLAWLVPARWGFAAGAATIGLPTGSHTFYPAPDHLWDHAAGAWLGDLAALGVVTALYVAATWWLLRRLDPQRR